MVDWSAATRPTQGRDSIWIADVRVGSPDPVRVENPSTRHDAILRLRDRITPGSERTLLAVDFSLGYPAGTARALGLTGLPWAATWDLLATLVRDGERNENNRFEVAAQLNARIGNGPGPFWGCPAGRSGVSLTTRKVAPDPLPTWRSVEAVLRSQGHRPFSSWQLLGAGAVGSQSLVGIAALAGLRRHLQRDGVAVDVWPFTSGLNVPRREVRPHVVICEVWPSLVDHTGELSSGRAGVRDEAQVRAVAADIARRDASGDLLTWFSPNLLAGPRPERAGAERAVAVNRRAVIEEEGWVLGVGVPRPAVGPASMGH